MERSILLTPLENIETKGKNHYFKWAKINKMLMDNSNSFTIITACPCVLCVLGMLSMKYKASKLNKNNEFKEKQKS